MSVAEEEKQLVREKANSKRFAFVLLGIAIVAEVTGAICLKASEGLTVPLPTLVTVIGYLIAFTLLIKILQNLPLGLVYGIWGGVVPLQLCWLALWFGMIPLLPLLR